MNNKKPNLIYIFADQLAYGRVGYNKDEYAYTPHIDEFSKDSMILDNCVSNHPVCAPYRASLMTGKYTTSTGMVINEIRLNPNHNTLPKVLKENGYFTSYFGKWHLYANKFNDHYNPESSFIPPGEHRLGFDEFEGYNFHHKYYAPFAYYHKNSKEKIYAKGYEPDDQVNISLEKLKKLKEQGKPFAFFLSIGTPHDPWVKENVPEEFYKMFENKEIPLPKNFKTKNDKYADPWARFWFMKPRTKLQEWFKVYYAMVANLDYNFDRLIKGIKELGLDKDSIIVFTSDHGEMFGSQGRHAKNIFYEEACRVPFLIRYEDKLKHIKKDTIFSSVDIFPTLLSLMDIKIPEGIEGEDKSKFLLNESINDDEFEGSLLMGTGKTALWGDGYEWRAFRTKQYTYAIYKKTKEEFLFDNLNDPYQLQNLVNNSNYKSVLEILKNKMKEKMEKIGDDFENTSFYKKYWVKNRNIKEHLPRRKDINKN